jgi:hypothetical protein
MEGSGLGLSPGSTRIVRWAIEITGASTLLIIFITRNYVKVSPPLWAILMVIPWIIFVIVLVYILIREEKQGSPPLPKSPAANRNRIVPILCRTIFPV